MLEELERIASEINLGDSLVKVEDVILAIDGKGDLERTFPVPDCERCLEKCCPAGVAVSLFDVARFIDLGLERFLSGTFEGYVELFLSDDASKVKLSRPYMAPSSPDARDCVFLNEERKCSIYENRPLICRAFPVAIRIDEDRNKLAIWMKGCQNYNITEDKEAFQRLLKSAVQDYNEKIISNSLLMYARHKLREAQFGRYMEDEWKILIEYNKKNRELEQKVKDLQETVERFRAPQDSKTLIDRLVSENEWLKERILSLEREIKEQSERAHSIIAELTNKVSSDYRKLLETFIESERKTSRGFWRR